jgi:hypothetical protein
LALPADHGVDLNQSFAGRDLSVDVGAANDKVRYGQTWRKQSSLEKCELTTISRSIEIWPDD